MLMGNNKYFREALSDFAFDAAYGDSIRHLHNSGYTPEQIREYLNTEALTEQKIREVIEKHTGQNDGTADDPDAPINNGSYYEFVKEYDQYGHSYFVRKKKERQE